MTNMEEFVKGIAEMTEQCPFNGSVSATFNFHAKNVCKRTVSSKADVAEGSKVSKKDVADATNNLGLNFDATTGEAFSIAGDVFVYNKNTNYSETDNQFLIKHEVIHYIQSKALGTPNDFLTAYETEYTYYTDTEEMSEDYAYYSISYEKGAYSFGPSNSSAKSYYKDIKKDKKNEGEFCGCD